jgi:hypothetical protein
VFSDDTEIVEAKCPHWSTKPHEFDPKKPPLHWWAQVQWQLWHGVKCGGGEAWIVAEWGYQEDQRREWPVSLDRDWCERVTDYVVWWWREYVETKTAPPLTTPAEMAAVAKACWPRVVSESLATANADEAEQQMECVAADDTAKAAKAHSEAMRDRLRYAIQDRAGVVSPEARATYRPRKDGVRVLNVNRIEVADGE